MRAVAAAAVLAVSAFASAPQARAADAEPRTQSCFLLYDLSAGNIGRPPTQACQRQVSPAATFDIPHALAALDAGLMKATASGNDPGVESLLRYSADGYFIGIAGRLGPTREREYLNRFGYGNADVGRGAGAFWNDGALKISPNEQLGFLQRLFRSELPVDRQAMAEVRSALRQPAGVVVGSFGAAPFGPMPWRHDLIVSAKSGSVVMQEKKEAVRWLVGHIKRGTRQMVFVSCVTGPRTLPENAAAVLANHELREARVF
ncbi:penicillin-binding transpeptidase domain-containing protein [Lysobacter firmicutimachus]|uniref:Penicillin-binding transpeptidase domain-containing protein n=1 Tax=Lysobacter firmicutimachus TaxID=1792846 RepID=A0AAU8MVU1_9GAMM|nr:penicillin-binding transpeptidase domain-containing protein [Lysobacter antibioticus]